MLDTPPSPLHSLADYERAAGLRLSERALAYIDGGAGDEITLRDNLSAWQRLALAPRVFTGVGERDLGVDLLGVPRAHPVLIAPTGFGQLTHPDGEVAIAHAATATDTVMCLSTLASTSPTALAQAVPDAPRWFQLYVFADRGITREMIATAADQGYEALVITADRPVAGVRDRELHGAVREPPAPNTPAAPVLGTASPADFSALIDPDVRWSDIERFVADGPLPVIIKGVLTVTDAQAAVAHGAAGVIVSNHGGRQLDTVPSGADALPAIADAVGAAIDVLVDGGVRRGTDIVKALALGARAVLIGRPPLWGLAVDGAAGVQRVIEILLGEFDRALALTGVSRARDLDRGVLTPARWTADQP